MRRISQALAVATACAVLAEPVTAQSTILATSAQNVTFSVAAINQISVTGTPTLAITGAPAGGAPTSVTDATSSYAITTNQSNLRIQAQINENMPLNVSLSASVAAPTGAATTGPTALSTTPANVVTGISQVNQGSLGISYTLTAAANAGTVPSQSRTVTFTVVTTP
jgi:hypothetical protein